MNKRVHCSVQDVKQVTEHKTEELDMINAISAADIAFIMSSSQAIVN